jgi:CHAD domain-containing protein
METSPLTKYLFFQIYSAKQLAGDISKEGDPENLHKFRVAIRRSRSLLGLYIPRSYAIGEVLKSLFKTTNELRELDVFLLSVKPEKYPVLHRELQKHRNRRYDKIWTLSYQKKCISVLERLHDDLFGINEHIDAGELEQKAMAQFKNSLDLYLALTPDTADEELHQLRIDFKISRYALEFVNESGIREVKEEITQCKKIQDKLGAVQDAKNQLELLKSFCKKIDSKECEKLLKKRKKGYKRLKKQATSSRSE